ncbi:Phage small terminase subunit [Ralstonia sp. 25mfcol4.1]|uniref:phage terminase small subunit n=1 Tax=Ralstonia sp. 25mfcol4.1 TaxID=1761899 RepID=UPI00087EA26C|nr:terminase endonuclease subunit [Ralstonia sp. 25mfcol4.1]SDP46275.1 Phage small terminase subunit [Ralstonia sp. 25mfcol4.1]
MTSPARRHYLRVTAGMAAAAEAAASPLRHATGHELMLAQLAEHKRSLKQIQSIERKAEAKRKMLPEYSDWVQGTLDADKGVQDEVFMTVMVWHIDVGDFAGALPLARYAIRHGLVMPDQYQRTTACLIAEEYASMAIKATEAGQPVDAKALVEVTDLVQGEDMPDEVRAKLHKALGYEALARVAEQTVSNQQAYRRYALDQLQRALQLHEKVGVKKDIERLERDIKNAGPAFSQVEGTG